MTKALKDEYIADFYKRYNRLPTVAELARFILFGGGGK